MCAGMWHCPLSLAQREGTLSDDKWRAIADDFVREMKFDGPTRWIVARHGLSAAGNDHVHLVVQLVREDGRQVNTNRDWPRAQAACNALEHKHGLEVIPSRERNGGRKAMTVRDIREAGHAEDQSAGRTPAEASRTRNERAGAQRDQLELRVRAAAKGRVDRRRFRAGSASGWGPGPTLGHRWTRSRLRSADGRGSMARRVQARTGLDPAPSAGGWGHGPGPRIGDLGS